MKLYLLTQEVNNDYDTFDSCVVAAENVLNAKRLSIRELSKSHGKGAWVTDNDDIKSKEIGTSLFKKEKIILTSFNAG